MTFIQAWKVIVLFLIKGPWPHLTEKFKEKGEGESFGGDTSSGRLLETI